MPRLTFFMFLEYEFGKILLEVYLRSQNPLPHILDKPSQGWGKMVHFANHYKL